MGRSSSLLDRLRDVEERLSVMRTVTNTASAQISGGETVIDENGSVFFRDGGTLLLGSSKISDVEGNDIITSEGNLVADNLVVYGDVLSARDYLYQREVIDTVLVDTDEVSTVKLEHTIEFPDWSKEASINIDIDVRSRVNELYSNPALVLVNGKTISRPKSNRSGDIDIDVSVLRKVVPDSPRVTVEIVMGLDPVPRYDAGMIVKIGGIFTA